jgi:hypothetical protein
MPLSKMFLSLLIESFFSSTVHNILIFRILLSLTYNYHLAKELLFFLEQEINISAN